MPTIESLSLAGLDYLRAFNLACIAISPTGRVYVSHNPAGASLAWWCRAEDADKIADLAQATGDVPGAASRLRVQLTEHAKLIARVRERTERIDAAIAQAKADGLLQRFHQESSNAAWKRKRVAHSSCASARRNESCAS
jgi:hypothetical protein